MRQAGGFRIERSDDFAFDTDLSTFRFLTRVDSKIVDDTAFVSITGAA